MSPELLVVTDLAQHEVERVTRALCRSEGSALVPTAVRTQVVTAALDLLAGTGAPGFLEVATHTALPLTALQLRAIVAELTTHATPRQADLPLRNRSDRAHWHACAHRSLPAAERGVLVIVLDPAQPDLAGGAARDFHTPPRPTRRRRSPAAPSTPA